MARLSIFIPAFGAVEPFERTLESVLRNRPRDCEVVVLTGRPYDDPYELAGEVRFAVARPGQRLLPAVNEALGQCHGDVIHLLASGSEVVEGWTEAALAHFDDPAVAIVAPLVLDARAAGSVISAGLAYLRCGARRENYHGAIAANIPRRAFDVIAASFGAGFFRAACLASPDKGFDASFDVACAEIDLGLRLQAAGNRAVCEPHSRIYSHPSREPEAESAFHGARQAERLFWRHAAAWGWKSSLAAHLAWLAAKGALGIVHPARLASRASGRMLGLAQTVWRRSRGGARSAGDDGRSGSSTRTPGATMRTDSSETLRGSMRPSRASEVSRQEKRE